MGARIELHGVRAGYGDRTVLDGIDLVVPKDEIFAIVGPANAGKTTLLRALQRFDEFIPGFWVGGRILVDGQDVLAAADLPLVRRRIGMVAPLPVGLPMSVLDNVCFAPRMRGIRAKAELHAIAERCLRQAALWDEVKDRLDGLATRLSGGQQQRLTIARALSSEPEVLCLDEFSIAIDPVTTMRIEEVLAELKENMTIVLVTNLVQQARRLARHTAMMLDGRVVEVKPTEALFGGGAERPETQGFLAGRFG